MAEMLGLRSLTAGGGKVMNAWSEYLRGAGGYRRQIRKDDNDG
jgi:hypothetical protein